MKEKTLRGMIRNQIKASLSEAPIAKAAIGKKLGSIEKMASVRMLKKALSSKMGRVDKTQAMGMLKKTLATKPATQQVDFIIAMIQGFDLKDAAKSRLILKMRQALK